MGLGKFFHENSMMYKLSNITFGFKPSYIDYNIFSYMPYMVLYCLVVTYIAEHISL